MLTASLLLLVAACARDVGSVSVEPATGPPAEDAVVLRVDYTGGFVTPTVLASRVPIVSVYGDGRVVSQGPQVLSYPGPALPNLQVRRIATADVETLVELALAAGVGSDPDLGQPPIADAASTRFTVQTDDGTEVLEVYALGEATGNLPGMSDPAGLSQEQVAARAELLDLLGALTDMSGTLGEDAVSQVQPYVPTAVAAISSSWAPDDGELPADPEVAWPGHELPGEPLGEGLDVGCVVATGEAADAVLAAAASATAISPWTSADSRWMVTLRPLLPDESGCEDLVEVS